MANVTEHKKYCCVDCKSNHNKLWQYTLYDNGDLLVEWGRVGCSLQTKMHPGGRHKLFGLLRNKEGKGYKEVETLESGQVQTHAVAQTTLKQVATEQIKHTSNEVKKLIGWLAEVNRHTILSNTTMTYNATNGLFSTPLGIVTPRSVSSARNLLATIQRYVAITDFDNSRFIDALEQYLVLIPQKVGHARGWHRTFLVDTVAVQQQNDILDSLDASYRAVMSGQSNKSDAGADEPLEKVFDVQISLLKDAKEEKRLFDNYYQTRRTQHDCYRLTPKKVYVVQIAEMHKMFETKGKKMGHVMELYHGSTASNLLSILKSGIRVTPPATAQITGKMFGSGAYFSDISTKALNYSYGYWGGDRFSRYFMFVANVAMGKYHVPSGSTFSSPPPGYDSYFAQEGKSGVRNNEMIVFKDYQIDLVYLMEF